MSDLEARVHQLERTLKCIRWIWHNPYMRLMIDRALIGNYDLVEDQNDK